jgi:hypothetical protein
VGGGGSSYATVSRVCTFPIVNSACLHVLRKPPARSERLRLRGLYLSGERVLIFDMAVNILAPLPVRRQRVQHEAHKEHLRIAVAQERVSRPST